jgi:uncharacterized protein (TIGR00299 family) protein
MKILYLDCFAGISGDMLLGALLDLGVSLEALAKQLDCLQLKNYIFSTEKITKNGITCTKANIHIASTEKHPRHLPDIINIINNSSLPQNIKHKSLDVFNNLAQAEAKIHGIPIDKLHFHEVGALDAIVDIVGSICAVEMLGAEQVVCSPLPLGSGFVECAHGTLPLPAPAVLEILRGIPTQPCNIQGETVTPTGAALIKTLATGFGPIPAMKIDTIGYGAGTANRQIPNLLRAVVGTVDSPDLSHSSAGYTEDSLNVIETNIDDMNPEFYEHITLTLLSSGCVDVFLTPIIMKKGRPGQLLTCLANEANTFTVINLLLAETSTLGVRTYPCHRHKLTRKTVLTETKFGPVSVKLGCHPSTGEVMNVAPEWEDCKRTAAKNNLPVKTIYDLAKTAYYNKLSP